MARKRRGAPIDHRKCKREQQKGTPFDYHPDQAQSTQQLPVDFLINLNALFTNENSGDRSQMSDSTKGETSGGDSASNSRTPFDYHPGQAQSTQQLPVDFLINLNALFTNENSGDRSQMSDSTKGETSGADSASNSRTPFDYHPGQAQSTQQLPVDFLINLNALFTNENSGDRSQMSDSTKGETSGADSASNSHASVKTNPVKFLIDLDMAEEASMSFTLTGQPIQSWIEKEARKNQRTVNPGHGKSRCAICQIDLQIKYEDHREMASHKTTFINSLTSAFHKSLKTRAKPETTH